MFRYISTHFGKGMLWAVVICLFSFGFHHVSQAAVQQDLAYNIKEVPKYWEISPEIFEQDTRLITVEPHKGSELSFSVRLPYDWAETEISKDKNIGKDDFHLWKKGVIREKKYLPKRGVGSGSGFLELIATFISPGDGQALHSSLKVEALELEQDILASDWLVDFIYTNGHTLQFMTPHNEMLAEALYVYLENGLAYIARTKVQINGSKVIMVTYLIPERKWNEQRSYQFHAIDSFHVLNKKRSRVIPTKVHSFLDILEFDYPESWGLEAPRIDSLHEMEASLIRSRNGKSVDGRINIMILSDKLKDKVPGRIESMKKNIELMGLTAGPMVEKRDTYDFNEKLKLTHVEVYTATDTEHVPKQVIDHELWIALFYDGQFYYIMDLLSPSRLFDKKEWIDNTQAFKVVVESMRL